MLYDEDLKELSKEKDLFSNYKKVVGLRKGIADIDRSLAGYDLMKTENCLDFYSSSKNLDQVKSLNWKRCCEIFELQGILVSQGLDQAFITSLNFTKSPSDIS